MIEDNIHPSRLCSVSCMEHHHRLFYLYKCKKKKCCDSIAEKQKEKMHLFFSVKKQSHLKEGAAVVRIIIGIGQMVSLFPNY